MSRRTLAIVISAGGAVGWFAYSSDWRSRLPQLGLSPPAGLPATPTSSPPLGAMNLRSVQILFRHGARTPLKHIPGLEEVLYDPSTLLAKLPHIEIPATVEHVSGKPRPVSSLQDHYNKTEFKGGIKAGVLTSVGKEQAYQLGQRLAARYRNFIGRMFVNSDIYLRSTNVDRCIESLCCCVAGLFNPVKINDPVLIHVENIEDEILFPNPRNCRTFQSLLKNSRAAYETSAEYTELVRRVQAHTGDNTPVTDFDMMQLRDHIVARQAHGLPVPQFLEDLYSEVDRAAVDVLLHYVCGYVHELTLPETACNSNGKAPENDNTTAATKNGSGAVALPTFRDCTHEARIVGLALAMGRTWHVIVENMLNAVDSSKKAAEAERQPKMLLFCCHDSSVAPLLLALGCYDNEWPPYCADIAFELYEDVKGQHWVNVAYCGKDMVLTGCSKPVIPLERFLELIKPFSITPDQHSLYCSDFAVASKLIGANMSDVSVLKEIPLPNFD